MRSIHAMQVKSVDEEDRTFEGLAATWDLDLQDDVIEKGAFKRWIRDWKKSGRVLPLLDSHSWFSIFDTVGKLIDAEERDEGLWTRWKIIPGPKGDEVLRLLASDEGGPFIDSLSIGYQPIKWHFEEDPERAGRDVRYLQEIRLDEVSLVRFPANPQAMTDPETVKKALTMHFEALEPVLGSASADVKATVKGILTSALERCEKGRCTTTKEPPATAAAPQVKSRPAAVPAAGAVGDDDANEPDRSKFDELRLRQLASRTPRTER